MTNPTPQQLPASVIRCMSARDKAALGLDGVRTGKETAKTTKPPVEAPRRLPNKTEAECKNLFNGNWVYEGRRFDICGGASYTPDWVDMENATAIESKGEFIHSRDSRRRFDEAKHLFPNWTWIWARLRTSGKKGKRWEIEVYEKSI